MTNTKVYIHQNLDQKSTSDRYFIVYLFIISSQPQDLSKLKEASKRFITLPKRSYNIYLKEDKVEEVKEKEVKEKEVKEKEVKEIKQAEEYTLIQERMNPLLIELNEEEKKRLKKDSSFKELCKNWNEEEKAFYKDEDTTTFSYMEYIEIHPITRTIVQELQKLTEESNIDVERFLKLLNSLDIFWD